MGRLRWTPGGVADDLAQRPARLADADVQPVELDALDVPLRGIAARRLAQLAFAAAHPGDSAAAAGGAAAASLEALTMGRLALVRQRTEGVPGLSLAPAL